MQKSRSNESLVVILGRLAKADWGSAQALFSESLQISEALGDRYRVARALSFLGQSFLMQGDIVQARRLCEESVRIYRELGITGAAAIPLGILGNLALYHGDLAQARLYYQESLALYREGNSEQNANWMLLNLSQVAARQGNYEEARAFIERSMAIHRAYGFDDDLGLDFSRLAFLARAQGDYEQANDLYTRSLPLLKDNKFEVMRALEGLAGASAMQGVSDRAITLFGAAAALREAINVPAPPLYKGDNERDMAVARTQLGEDAANTAWEAGRSMTMEQAVTFALETKDEA